MLLFPGSQITQTPVRFEILIVNCIDQLHFLICLGLDLIIQVAARILKDQSLSEDASIPVGSLLTRLLVSAGNHIGPILPQIVSGIMSKLGSIQNRLLKQVKQKL